MPTAQQHPLPQELTAFSQGRLSDAQMAAVETHVAGCDQCCEFLSQTPDDQLADLARAAHEAGTPTVMMAGTDTDVARKPAPDDGDLSKVPVELAEHPRYRVQKVIGRGGMGIVYKAEHRMMQRPVALKVINRRFIANSEAIERFHQEVRAAAQLSHPNIVGAFDAEQAGNLHFLVMEYVEGKSLAQWVQQRGPLTIVQACNATRQICQGLQHAHERGMTHRDIKPQNLMLAKNGKIKILDFGLARFEREQIAVSPTAPTESELTAFGTLLGTPDYMAPEQATDARLADARSDIFSLGSTLYFLLTGRSPFEAGSFTAMISKGVQREMVPLTSLRKDLPKELVTIVERMMALKPSERFASVVDVAEALTPFGRGEKGSSADAKSSDDAGVSELKSLVEDDTSEAVPEKPSSKSRSTSLSRRRPAEETEFGDEPTKWREAEEDPAWRRRTRPRGRPARPTLQVLATRLFRRWGKQAALALLAVALLYGAGSWVVSKLNQDSLAANGADDSQQDGTSGGVPEVSKTDGGATTDVALQSSKRVLMLLPAWSFWWPDYGPPRKMLEAAGAQVTVASWQREAHPLKDGGGSSVAVDLLLHEVNPADYDAIMICGGPGIEHLIYDKPEGAEALRLVKTMKAKGRLVSAICMGPIVLAKAGLLDGIPVTGSPLVRDKCSQKFGITFTDAPVERDGNIITGRDADSADQFVRVLLKALAERQ